MENQQSTKGKSRSFSNINTKSFILVVVILTVILVACGTLSYFVPQGQFLRDEVTGTIINGTYVQGDVEGIAIWRIITAPFRVFISEDALTIIFICLFLL